MTAGEAPSHEDIITALKQSGYLMEQKVATQLEALGFHVQTNRAYEDADEGKSREIDIQAIKRIVVNEKKKLAAYVEIIGECKNSSNPFVFIGRPKNQTDNKRAPTEYIFPIMDYEARKKTAENTYSVLGTHAFFHLGIDTVHYNYISEAKAVQFCRIDRNGKNWHANHSGLYDAIFYPMAKAIASRKGEIPKNDRNDDWKYFWFFIPLVIVSSDIFYVDSLIAEPAPEKRGFVTFRRELKSKNLKGAFAVDFVVQSHLETFVAACLNPIIERVIDLTSDKPDFVLTREIPWKGE